VFKIMYSLLIMVMVTIGSCRTQKDVREANDVREVNEIEPQETTTDESVEPDLEGQQKAAKVESIKMVETRKKLAAKKIGVGRTEPEDLFTLEALPTTPLASTEDLELAERIATFKRTRDRGVWWECGKRYKLEEFDAAALEWAKAVNKAYNKTTYKLRSGKIVKVNKAEALGIMVRETRLDRCAVGPYPRIFAYKNNIIKKKPGVLSHTMEEIERVFTHWRFQGRLADIGPGQIVKRIGKGKKHIKWATVKDFLSLDPGVQLLFDEMADRGRMYSTHTPSNKWPGNGDNTWYTLAVLRIGGKITGKPQTFYQNAAQRERKTFNGKKPVYLRSRRTHNSS